MWVTLLLSTLCNLHIKNQTRNLILDTVSNHLLGYIPSNCWSVYTNKSMKFFACFFCVVCAVYMICVLYVYLLGVNVLSYRL